MRRLLQTLVLLLSGVICAQGQEITQTIKGTIIDKQSQAPVPGVIVIIQGTQPQKVATTDTEGKFRITDVPVGRWNVRLQLLGYAEKVVTVILNAGKEGIVNAEMEESVIAGDEVVVTATQDKTSTNNKMTTVSARLFSSDEAARYAGSRNDPARMAANFAGVSGANDSRNDIIIRGNSPIGLLWRLNGVDIPNPNHFGSSGSTGGPVSILNNNTLDNSDFLTGAFPADYGNATSGAFDLRMRQGNSDKNEFLAQVGFNGFELGAEGPLNKKKNATMLLNYRFSTLSVFKALNIDFGTGAAVPQYQDLTFKSDITTKNAGKFSIWGLGGLSYVALLESDKTPGQDLYGFSGRDTYFRSNLGATGISHIILFRNNAYLRSNIAVSANYNNARTDRVEMDSLSGRVSSIHPEYRQENQNIRYSFNTTYNRKFNSRNTTSFGIYTDILHGSFVDSTTESDGHTFITLRNYKGTSALLRAFYQWQHRVSDNLQFTAGLSNQFFTLNSANAVEPRAGIRYNITTRQSLSFGGGLHSQLQPTYIYFASVTENGVKRETNKELDFTRACHLVTAYDINVRDNFRIKAEIYYQYLFRVPVKNEPDHFSVLNLGADFTSPNVANLVSRGTGYNYGFELTVEKFYSKGYYFLFTSSLFQSRYAASDKIERNTAFNGNYVFNLLGGKEFRIRKRHTISIDIRATYAGGKRYTPVDLDASIAAQREIRDQNRVFAMQYPDYFRMDVKPGYRYNSKKLTHEFSIDIQNVTRNLNVFQQTYNLITHKIQTDYQLKFFVVPQYRVLF